jgi:hypothetical protein
MRVDARTAELAGKKKAVGLHHRGALQQPYMHATVVPRMGLGCGRGRGRGRDWPSVPAETGPPNAVQLLCCAASSAHHIAYHARLPTPI